MMQHFSPHMRRVYQLAMALTALSVLLFAAAFVVKHTQPGSDTTDLLWLAVGIYILAVSLGSFLPYPPRESLRPLTDEEREQLKQEIREDSDGRYITRHIPREPTARANGDASK